MNGMVKPCENRYKLCRESAGLTQEATAELLAVSTRTLSDYENDHANVPDDVVDRMVDVYQAPMLAWWHLKTHNPLGRRLPDFVPPTTNGDMAFAVVLANDELSSVTVSIKDIMSDGVVTEGEKILLMDCFKRLRGVSGKVLSAAVFGEISYQHADEEVAGE
jgi:transcriptional regulator with XRE-family HTH domain